MMAISDQELRLSEIEHARISAAALSVLDEPIEKAKNEAIKRLINLYRSEKTSHDALVGIAAELSALDKLVSTLTNDVRRGETAFQKEHDRNAQNR